MHFINKNNVLWGVFALKCFVFQNFDFSKFLIDQNCCSTDRKCDKNFGYNLPGSIGAQLVLDRSKLLFDWPNLLFDRSKIGKWVFKKVFLSCVLRTFQIFSKALSLFLLDWSNLSLFCHFLPNFSQVSLSSSVGKTFLPFLFQFIHNFHAFLLKFLNLRLLGFLIFRLFSFTFDHWVFVSRWY